MTQPLVNVAVQAARKAGDLTHRYLSRLDRIPITEKARHDYVSEVDRACEVEIVREIRRLYPNHAFLAEESGATGDSDHVWIIDPLDGTSNYLHGIPHYAISIALQIKGRTEHAVVYDPVREELFTASRGRGAVLNNQKLRVSPRKGLSGSILATALPFRQRDKLDTSMAVLGDIFSQVEDIRRAGAASLDLAYVAAGRLDGYWEFGLQPWDVAAGALLVREAGGVVQDFSGSDKVENSDSIIAAPFKLMTPLQRIINSHWRQD